jgi:putative acetyltransferase
MKIREERPGEGLAIRALTEAAFAPKAFSDGTEGAIIDRLRDARALSVSLVADDAGLVGHIAFSRVSVDGKTGAWYGLGPVAVATDRQGQGIGSALIRTGLGRLANLGATCVFVLGDPDYYARFGFESVPTLWYGAGPSRYFQHLVLTGSEPLGQVRFHAAFGDA